ncbi:hypothetical protein [Spirosoma gilvum]
MYLEERVEQLETLAVDHGRQIETIAKGVADLTVTVNHRFDRVDKRFDQVDNRFNRVDDRFDRVENDISELKSDVSSLKTDVADLKAGQARLETTVELILTILQERLK